MPSISSHLAGYFAGIMADAIPIDVRQFAKLLILDAIGVSVAGLGEQWGRQACSVAMQMGGGPESTVFGHATRVSSANAALANGCLSQALDFDDTYLPAILHPSCCIVPVALAVGEVNDSSGSDALTAAICGYEMMIRLAEAAKNNLFRRNYHTLGLLGPIGAAVTASRLLNADAGQMTNAIGIAASLGGGVLQAIREGQHVKALRAGYAGHAGIVAAQLAAQGVEAPRQIFEGELGFFRTFLDENEYDLAILTDALGSRWYVPQISVKLFPGGHRSHYYMQSAIEMREANGIDPADIETICCVTSPKTEYYNFTPQGYAPPTSYIARFSVPFVLATAFRTGRVELSSFGESAIRDAGTLSLAGKVTHVVRDDADEPGKRGTLIVTFRDGRSVEHTPKAILGTPELPASRDTVVAKFNSNVAGSMSAAEAYELAHKVLGLDELDSVAELARGLGKARAS